MSKTCICIECGKEAGYFNGKHAPTANDKDNLFCISKIEGDAGVSYDEQILAGSGYLCKNCLQKCLPNSLKFINENLEFKCKLI